MRGAGSDGMGRRSRRRPPAAGLGCFAHGIAAGVAKRRWWSENPALIETREQAEKTIFNFACYDSHSLRSLHSALVIKLARLLGGRRFAKRYAAAVDLTSPWGVPPNSRPRRRMEEIRNLFSDVRQQACGCDEGGVLRVIVNGIEHSLEPDDVETIADAERAMDEAIRRLWPKDGCSGPAAGPQAPL